MVDEKNKPMMKTRKGAFQICVWKRKRIIAPREHEKGYVPERERDETRASIQYSKKVGNDWKRQTIWCSPEQLRDLAIALGDLSVPDEEGDDPSHDAYEEVVR